MSDKRYNIVLTGELVSGSSEAVAITGLEKIFKIDTDKAARLLARAPLVVKKDVDELTAEKYNKVFRKYGLISALDDLSDKTESDQENDTEAGAETENSSPVHEPEKAAEDCDTPTVANPIVDAKEHLGMTHTIEGRPDYSYLTVQIPPDQTIKVEASAMATMDTNVKMKTKLKGGFGRFLTGESLFVNEFTAQHGPGEIGIAPGTPGDLMHQYLDGDTIFLQNSAYVASSMEVELETKWQGMIKGFFSGESLFLIRCSGVGDLWFNTYGAIIEIDVAGDYVVDTGNIVAFTEGLDYDISKVGGYKSLFFSGEGFVCRFSGKGKVWIQTRSASAFTSWAHFYRPVGKKG